MEDMISREKAIDELCMMLRACFGADDEELDAVTVTLNELPSAQPETHEERTETHACDLIDRQDAIRIVDSIDTWQAGWRGNAIESLKAMPSAQPEIIREIRKWINSGNRGNADYFIVEKIEEIINKYE